MASLIRYLLLANFFLIIMALFYHLVLSRETWFRTNRLILVLGTTLCLILPLFQLNWFPAGSYSILTIPEIIISAKSGIAHFDIAEIQIFGTAPYYFPWLSLIGWTYIIGAIAAAGLLIWKVKKLQYWTRHYPMKWFSNLYITLLPENWSPFSFLGIVYYPGSIDKTDRRVNLILEHERVHIRQKHGWDIMFIEAVKILFFYNPAVYTIQKQIQINHEYLADSEVVGEKKKEYSQDLIRSHFQVPQYQFIQQFNQSSLLKRRILMIMKNKTNSIGFLKYLLILPLVGGLLWFSACTDEAGSVKDTSTIENNVPGFTLDKTKSVVENYAMAIMNSDITSMDEWELQTRTVATEMLESGKNKNEVQEFVETKVSNLAIENIEQIKASDFFRSTGLDINDLKIDNNTNYKRNIPEKEGEVFYIVEDMPEFDGGGLKEFQNWVQRNVKYPDIALENGIAGTVYVNFLVNKIGEVSNIDIVRSVDPCLDDEVKRVLKSAPSWKPGKQRGENVNVQFSLPVKFLLQ